VSTPPFGRGTVLLIFFAAVFSLIYGAESETGNAE